MNTRRASGLVTIERELLVVESSGGPRSGKGTITEHLGNSYPGAQTDETGADYRALTLGLLHDGRLDPDMTRDQVQAVVGTVDPGDIVDLVAARYEIVATHGKSALESDEVGRIVGHVSPLEAVRVAVKAGFTRRVERQIENGTSILFVDGRNLQPVIEKIVGAKILLRTFIDCQVAVAVLREANRQKIDLNDPEADEWFNREYEKIEQRRKADEQRPNDPAIRDADAINYWFNGHTDRYTNELYATRFGYTVAEATRLLKSEGNSRKGGRYGAGTLAYQTGRQLYFDTTEVPLHQMLAYAKRFVDEALDAFAEDRKAA